jgi:hypothetical protein
MAEWLKNVGFLAYTLVTSWRRAVRVTSRRFYPREKRPRYPLNRKVSEPHNWSGQFVKENFLPRLVVEPRSVGFPACALITEVLRLVVTQVEVRWLAVSIAEKPWLWRRIHTTDRPDDRTVVSRRRRAVRVTAGTKADRCSSQGGCSLLTGVAIATFNLFAVLSSRPYFIPFHTNK